MKYHKLIRDNIPDIIRAKGDAPVTHIADDAEYWLKLKEKLHEELAEFTEAENMEELADILEVIDAIIDYKGFDRTELHALQQAKRTKRGGFMKRIILDES